jgi:hypothetical protein
MWSQKMDASQDVREHLFKSTRFREEIAARLELDPELVSDSLEALFDADVIPFGLPDPADALSADGAAVLLAIGGHRRHAPSVGLSGMALCGAIGDRHPAAGIADTFPSTSEPFGRATSEVLRYLWKAARDPTTRGFAGVSVSIFWSDAHEDALFGTIEHRTSGRHRVYASEPAQARDIKYAAAPVGGVVYAPKALLRFGALLDAAVADTSAALKGRRPAMNSTTAVRKPA